MKKEINVAIQEFQKQFIDNETFMKMLKISRRTAQNYRDEKRIPFVIIGNKIWYKTEDIMKMMQDNYTEKSFFKKWL